MFAQDIEANKKLTAAIKGKKVCMIGDVGSIGSSFYGVRWQKLAIIVVFKNSYHN